jgi:hypothetical protein
VGLRAIGRAAGLALVTLALCACIGRLSLAANMKVEPHLILPGNKATVAIEVEGDGLLGNAVRQQLTPAAFQRANDVEWEFRDNSDAQTVRFRATSSANFPATFEAQQVPAAGAISLTANDYVFLRRYHLVVTVAPTQSATASSTDAVSQQTAAAALAAIRYDWSVALPGNIETTNGVRSDDGRIIWHLNMSARDPQVLSAQSTYVDVPRIALGGAALLLITGGLVLRRRRRRQIEVLDRVAPRS